MPRGSSWTSTDDKCLSAMAAMGAGITAIWQCYPSRTRCAVKARVELLRARVNRGASEWRLTPVADRYPYITLDQDTAFHDLMIGRTYG